MEQKIIEVSTYWVKSAIEHEYEMGWFVAAITLTEKDRYMVVFQRQKRKEKTKGEAKQPSQSTQNNYSARQRTGYVARPE